MWLHPQLEVISTTPDALAIAVEHHQAGRLAAAEEIYRQILAIEPNHVDALHLLGVVASQTGNQGLAVECIRRAIELKGDEAAFHCNLGNAYKVQGKLSEAADCYRRGLHLKPDDAGANYNLGIVLQEQERLDEAVACFKRAVELAPSFPEAHNNLGKALQAQEKLTEAIACYREALRLKPDFPEAESNLGTVFLAQKKLDEAVARLRRAVELNSEYAEAHSNLGAAYQAQGKLEEAVASCSRALALKPDYAEAHSNLANALQDQGKYEEAVVSYRRALELKSDYAAAHYNLGNALKDLGRLEEAVASYGRALELKPDHAEAHNNLGTALNEQGKPDEAIGCLRRAIALNPEFAEAHSNLLLVLQYQAGATLAGLAAAHAEYEQRHAAALRVEWRPHDNGQNPERRLRVGFVSPDFGQHPVGYFLIRALENLERRQCEVLCYNDRTIKDELTARFQAASGQWRDVHALNDQELSETIRADRIDILFDLAGHTSRNRLLVFARKPAPIQIAWAGYVGTTGLKAMDYILADRHEIPPGTEVHYVERVLRMPEGYVCLEPPADAPAVSALPALTRGHVTFGSFNNPAKITGQVVEVWAEILRRVPYSRLVLKHRAMNDLSIAGRLAEEFASHGIDPGRIDCRGWSPRGRLLEEYHDIDLALDPFPYSGGLTTCEALWMGVPVITCPGETFASRHSLSHLSSAGVTETVARDLDDYVDLVVSLSQDSPRLTALRKSLRKRVAASPLCNGKRFAENLMAVLRDAWRRWCGEMAELDAEQRNSE